jgi:N6-adenosine-specific RNA methylase IME4
MSVEEISALPVAEWSEPDAHLYLWTTNGYLEDAFSVARAWGFQFSTLLTWAKKPMGSGLGGAWGISTEHVLFCRRGRDIAHGRHAGTCFTYKRPYENGAPKHSAKPPEFLDDIEGVSPGSYLELFSRETEPRLGWDYHGDQSLGTAQIQEAANA